MAASMNGHEPQQAVVVQEIIGRAPIVTTFWGRRYPLTTPSVDKTRPDYEFWDKLRRGKAQGYEFGGLFCWPLAQTVAMSVLGSGISASLITEKPEKRDEVATDADAVEDTGTKYTDKLLSKVLSRTHGVWLNTLIDLYGLGDQWVAVNPDGSFSVISPELVDPEYDKTDYRKLVKVTITSYLDEYTLVDEYRVDGRTLTIKKGGAVVETRQFENLIGRLPIVHLPNDISANEIYGRPIYEALLKLLSRYDDLIVKGMDGAELMGNPIPTFEGMENVNETIDANASIEDEAYTDIDGNDDTRKMINWDTLSTIFVGKGGSFKFSSPSPGWTVDVRDMLKSLFYLILDFTHVPEGVWGGAIASSRASLEAQMPPYHQYIEGRRVQLEGEGTDDELGYEANGGLYELIDIWLRTRRLTDPQIVVGPVKIEWPELSENNWEVALKWVSYLKGAGILDDETALTLSGLVDDPVTVLTKAKEEGLEAQREQMEFQQELGDAIKNANQNAQTGDDEPVNDRVRQLPAQQDREGVAA
jgi:hypothetical protein